MFRLEEMPEGFDRLKVAAISMKPQKWDKQSNASKMEKLFTTASDLGAQVALITEGALEGYVVEDVIRNPKLGPRLLETSEEKDGPYLERFGKLARTLRMCLCIGFAQRVGREVYNSAVFIDHNGHICGEHHKMQFAEGYHHSWFFNRLGKQIRAFDTPFGRAGFLICNDRWNPLLGRALALDGAQVIYIPAYGSRRLKQNRAVLAISRENGIPVVEANVGANLIISKGEVVTFERGFDKVTVADIEIPWRHSHALAKKVEHSFLSRRRREMKETYDAANRHSGKREYLLDVNLKPNY